MEKKLDLTPIFAITGAILGLPLSYFFQPGLVRAKLSLGDYLKALPDLVSKLDKTPSEIVAPIIITPIICAVIGALIGYFIMKSQDGYSKNETNSISPNVSEKMLNKRISEPSKIEIHLDADEIARKEILEEKIKQEPTNINTLIRYGDFLREIKNFNDALIQYYKVLEIDQNNLDVLEKIVTLNIDSENYQKAIKGLIELISKAPNKIEFKEMLFYCLKSTEKSTEAKNLLDKLLEQSPNNIKYLKEKMNLCLILKDDKELFKTSLKIHKEYPFKHPAASLYLSMHIFDTYEQFNEKTISEAEKLLEFAFSKSDDLSINEINLIKLYICCFKLLHNRGFSKIIIDLNEINERELDENRLRLLSKCYFIEGSKYFKNNEIEKTILYFEKGNEIFSTKENSEGLNEAYLKKAKELSDKKNYNAAIGYLEKAVKLNGNEENIFREINSLKLKKRKEYISRLIFGLSAAIILLSIGIGYYYGRESFIIDTDLDSTITIKKGDNEIFKSYGRNLNTDMLFFGDYTLIIDKEGYAGYKDTLSSRFGRKTNKVDVKMKPMYGSIKIDTNIKNTTIKLKNSYQNMECKTPCQINEVFAIENEIQILPNEYNPVIIKKRVEKDKVMDLGLISFLGSLKIDCETLNSDVFINGEYKGKTPITVENLPSKRTKVEIIKKGEGLYITYIDIPFQDLIDLGKIALSNAGGLIVNSRPEGADIFLDSKKVGKTPAIITDIEAGKHEVALIYQNQKILKAINISKGEHVDLKTISFFGGVKINSNPNGADVLVNNQKKGVTPFSYNEMPIGDSIIELELGGRKVFREKIKIDSDRLSDIGNIEIYPFLNPQIWEGYYNCSQGKTVLKIFITKGDQNSNFEGIFDFNFEEKKTSGQYYFSGKYFPIEKVFQINPGNWINRPERYNTIGLRGVLSDDYITINGNVSGGSYCKDFYLKKSANTFKLEEYLATINTKSQEKRYPESTSTIKKPDSSQTIGINENEIKELVVSYYNTKGEWARVFVIDYIDKMRIVSKSESEKELHIRYKYKPTNNSSRRDTGFDQRIFILKKIGDEYKIAGMGGHMSANF